MKWKHLFTSEVLKRGEQYKKSGRVSNLTNVNKGKYTANVYGSNYNVYSVSIKFSSASVESMGCGCQYAQSGRTCKHMAAVLYALESQNDQMSVKRLFSSREKIKPFSSYNGESDKDSYRYFDMSKITNELIIYDDTYDKAKGLLESSKFTVKSIGLDYNYEGGLCCAVMGQAERINAWYPVMVSFSKDGIEELKCAAYGCKSYYSGYNIANGQREPCEHTLALLIAADKFIRENDFGDSTDQSANRLLESFRKTRSALSAAMSAGRDVALEPRITKEYGRLNLSFRIGCDKMYVVRNLPDLVEHVEEREEISFGKLKLNFANDRIREQDIELYNFIKGVIDDEYHHNEQIQRYNYFGVSQISVKSDIALYGQRLDSFVDFAHGKDVIYIDKDTSSSNSSGKPLNMLKFGHDFPKISLKIRKDTDKYGVFHGVVVSGTAPDFFSTPRYRYFLDGDVLNRVSSDVRALEPIFDLIDGGKIHFRIGRQNLSEFYYTVLPQLREYINVEENDAEVVEQYLPPEVRFAFYLDIIDGTPVCRAVSQYGELSRPTMDCLNDSMVKERFRDVYRELQAIQAVQRYFPQVDKAGDQFICGSDEDAVYNMLESGIVELAELGEVQGTDRFRCLRIRPKVQVKVGVSVSGDLMNLEIGSTDVSREELLEILRSYKQKKRYHRLKSGDFVNIEDNISELSAMIDTMRLSSKDIISGKIKIPTYRALYLDNMSKECGSLEIKRDKYFRKIIQSFKTVSESDFDVPDNLQDIMRGYQVYGHKWLRTLGAYGFGGILADDMGLGKTLQMISVFSAAQAEGREGTSIVICPSSLIYNWIEEVSRFAPELSACAIVGTQKERSELISKCGEYHVIVTSYDLFKRDINLYQQHSFLYQVLDEAQYIKTHTTAAAKSVKMLQSKTRFALTGTPIENRLSELWSIFDYLMPGFLYGYDTFKKEYESPIAKKNDADTVKRLKRMVSPFILRRLKADVLNDLPDKIEEVRYAKFAKEQQLVYDSQVICMRNMLDSQDDASVKKNKLQIMAELTKIRQICCDPSLLFEDYNGGSAKRETCIDLINSAIEGEHRILLFSQFTSMLDLLEQDLRKTGIEYFKITGSTPKKERMQLVQSFNSGNTPVFLISLKAGGTGLNLTGADVVIHYDPWWNVAAQNQATDRAHRIGQTKTVSVYRIIVKNSIEEKILKMQELKKNLADEIHTGGGGNIAEMSREDILELLS